MKVSEQQVLANLIQTHQQVVNNARSGYNSTNNEIKNFFINMSLEAQENIDKCKNKLKINYGIDYDADSAKYKVIKDGSTVEVTVDHMDGMKGSTALIKGYNSPAMISDITMKDGMKMYSHKWLTNDEVKLK